MLKKFFEKSLLEKVLEAIVFLGIVFLGFYFQWEIDNFVFLVLFGCLIFHPIPSRFAVFGAVLFLGLAAIFPMFGEDSLAETCFTWAYYLMILSALLLFFQLHEEKDGGIIDKSQIIIK